MDLSSFLNTFEVRHVHSRNKKMSIMKREPAVDTVPFLLPSFMIQEGLHMIDRAAPFETIHLTSQVDPTVPCWVLTIDVIGDFTHRQVMAMHYISSLVKACKDGMACFSWLMGKVDDHFEGDGPSVIAKRLLEAWPHQRLPGFGNGFDLNWTHVFCAHNNCWYNDNFIHAFGITLAAKYKNNTTMSPPKLTTPAQNKGKRVPPATLSLLAGSGKDMVLMPLNLNDNHWACLVVDNPRKAIYCYDSLDKRANRNLLAEIADELVLKGLPHPYSITAVRSPIQKDSDNCGLFVCLYFWRRFDKKLGNDYTPTGLMRRRWDILRAVVDFSDASQENKEDNEEVAK